MTTSVKLTEIVEASNKKSVGLGTLSQFLYKPELNEAASPGSPRGQQAYYNSQMNSTHMLERYESGACISMMSDTEYPVKSPRKNLPPHKLP